MAPSDRPGVTPPPFYEGSAFHPALEGGRAPGRIVVGSSVLRFETLAADCAGEEIPAAAPPTKIELPLRGLGLRLGGASDRILFFSHDSLPEVTVFTSDHAVLEHPHLASERAIVDQVAAVRQKKSRGRMMLAAVLAGLVLALVGLVMLKDPLVGVVARQIPPGLEVRLGDMIFSQMEPTLELVEDPELQAELSELVAPLLAAVDDARYPFEFHIAEDASLNAFAVPGGNVVLHSALLLAAETPEEVLGVLAHEIAHVTRRHSLRNIISTVGVLVVVQTLLGDASAIIAVAAEGGARLLTLQFSRDFEREADDVGWEYLLDAGIDPRGMIRFFEKMQAEMEAKAGAGAALEGSLAFLSTHPSSRERIERLTARWEELGYTSAPVLEVAEFAAFQDRLRQSLISTPAPEGT